MFSSSDVDSNLFYSSFASMRGLISLALLSCLIRICGSQMPSNTSRNFNRNHGFTLNAINGSVSSLVVSQRAECVVICGRINDCCCTQYDKSTRKCTFARTDYFELVVDASGNSEVGVDRTLCSNVLVVCKYYCIDTSIVRM